MKKELTREIKNEKEIVFALKWAEAMIRKGLPGGSVLLSLGRARRTLDQNAKLWPMLKDVASQCDLVINGHPVKGSKEDWKHVFTASLFREQRMALGIDGQIVVLGHSTRRLSKQNFSDLIELIYVYGANNGVVWSEKSKDNFNNSRQPE